MRMNKRRLVGWFFAFLFGFSAITCLENSRRLVQLRSVCELKFGQTPVRIGTNLTLAFGNGGPPV